MSVFTVGIVAEGPRDVDMISALLSRMVLNHEIRILVLQPESSATKGFGSDYGLRGGGWTGVKRWCEMIAKDFDGIQDFLNNSTPKIDLLIIHLDADVSREESINLYAGCPPILPTIKNLEMVIKSWLNHEINDSPIVLCIPSDNLEAWVMAAYGPDKQYHNPPNLCIECLQKPEYIISNQNYKPKRIMSTKKGMPDKSRTKYAPLIRTVVANWDEVKIICGQAAKFEQEVSKILTPSYD